MHMTKKKKVQDEDWMPKCESCAFFNCEPKDEAGPCRRYPPVVIQLDGDFETAIPIVHRKEWCGEFVRKIN